MIRLVQTLLVCAPSLLTCIRPVTKCNHLAWIRPIETSYLCAPPVLTWCCPRSGGQFLLAYDQACTDLTSVCTISAYLLLPSKWWAVSASSASNTRNSKGAAVSAPMVAAIVWAMCTVSFSLLQQALHMHLDDHSSGAAIVWAMCTMSFNLLQHAGIVWGACWPIVISLFLHYRLHQSMLCRQGKFACKARIQSKKAGSKHNWAITQPDWSP